MILDTQQKNSVAYIKYDLIAIKQLLEDYRSTESFLIDELPDVNWNSQADTYKYFCDEHNVSLQSQTIAGLKLLLETTNEEEYMDNVEECAETLTGLIELKKIQSVIRNYLLQLLKHSDEDGYYPLRFVNGEWVQQNKREISYCLEIQECIIEMHIPNGADKGTKEI